MLRPSKGDLTVRSYGERSFRNVLDGSFDGFELGESTPKIADIFGEMDQFSGVRDNGEIGIMKFILRRFRKRSSIYVNDFHLYRLY